MCSSTPKMPPPAPPPQEQKAPDTVNARRRGRGNTTQGGTLLTSPSGVAGNALNTGGTTLLGG